MEHFLSGRVAAYQGPATRLLPRHPGLPWNQGASWKLVQASGRQFILRMEGIDVGTFGLQSDPKSGYQNLGATQAGVRRPATISRIGVPLAV